MSTFSIKPGAALDDMAPAICEAIPLIANVFWSFGYKATITCGTDGKHKENSLHYEGKALDWRTWTDDVGTQMAYDLKMAICREILRELASLSDRFQFEIESTHIHIEYDDRGY